MDTDKIRDAMTAEAQALAELKAAADGRRAALFALVRQGADAGMRQVDIVRATGWTREYVAGIVSGKRGAAS